ICALRGAKAPARSTDERPAAFAHRPLERTVPVLRYGSMGPDVKKLQQLLNNRLTPSPKQAADSYFGSLTLAAVHNFQPADKIRVDGVVGKVTWYHLLANTKPVDTELNGAVHPGAASASLQRTSGPAPKRSVLDWPLHEKFEAAIKRTASHLPGEIGAQFK